MMIFYGHHKAVNMTKQAPALTLLKVGLALGQGLNGTPLTKCRIGLILF